MDDNLGQVSALPPDQASRTAIVYACDHGENLGARGLWGKASMWKESVGVPLIVKAPGQTQALRLAAPASLVDLYPCLFEAGGAPQATPVRPGRSLRTPQALPADRAVFAEHHGAGARTGVFMLRPGDWKLVH